MSGITDHRRSSSLADLARIFLRLGVSAFGGPAAHISMMEREFVEERTWISEQRFLDLIAAVNLIPGPNSTELAIHIGLELAGWRGLLIAGACFIGPAFAIVLLCSWLYVEYGALPDATAILSGIKPVVIAVIAHAVWKLGGRVMHKASAILLALLVFAAGLLGVNELVLLLGSGLLFGLYTVWKNDAGKYPAGKKSTKKRNGIFLISGIFGNLFAVPTGSSIFLYFLYVGSVLYGSGYVLVAFLQDDLVNTYGWLTSQQLIDAVAIGQVTPGPVFTTATFIGYILGGVPGSILATIGIFLPSFCFVLLAHRALRSMRSRLFTAGFLDGVSAAAIALIAVVLIVLGQQVLLSVVAWGIACVALLLLVRTRINTTWLILSGGILGWVTAML